MRVAITLDPHGESEPFVSPRYEAPVFVRQNAPQRGEGYYLAYADDGSPTNGNQYEQFPTLAEAEAFAARHRFVPADSPAALAVQAIAASGLSVVQFAERIAWRDERTVRRWIEGDTIPERAQDRLRWFLALPDRERDRFVAIARS